MLYQQQPLKLGARPVVLRTVETGKRASQLIAHAGMQRVTRGLWAVHPRPLTPVERALLLQQHLGAPGSTLAVTGFNALDILRIPVGYTEHWVHQSLRMPCPRIMQNFSGERESAHLRWSGGRTQSVAEGIKFSKSLGLGTFAGPWDSRIAHPVEALVVVAPRLSHWRIVACLDAMMSWQFTIPGTGVTAELPRAVIEECLSHLPPHSLAVNAVRKALRESQESCFSAMETLTRMIALHEGLPPPQLNYPVKVNGRTFYLDLAWPEFKVAVEYNGRVHADEVDQYRDEMYRFALLRDSGWDVTLLVKDDLKDPGRRRKWVERVRRATSLRCVEF